MEQLPPKLTSLHFTLEHFIALFPILVVGATIVICLLSISFKRNQTLTATLTMSGLAIALIATVFAITQTSGLPSRMINVTELFVFNRYTYFIGIIIILVAIACTSFSHIYLEGYPGNKDEFYVLLLLSTLGALLLVSSDHMIGLFIGIELLSVPMYGLIGYAFFQRRSLEASIKYMILSAVGTGFLLFGMALVFADIGSFSFSRILFAFHFHLITLLIQLGIALMIVGFAFKLSLAPFHLWTPDVYEGAPAPAATFLATVSKLAVFAMLVRFAQYVPISTTYWMSLAITLIAIASILVGNLMALFQQSVKRILGYSSISHFGYLLTILLVVDHTVAAKTATIYLLTYIATTLAAFSIVTVLSSPCEDRDVDALYKYRGLFWRRPMLTVALSITMLSLAGIPLTAGFIGKFWLLKTAISYNLWLLTAMVVVGSAIALYYYLRVMVILYLPEPTAQQNEEKNIRWTHRVATLMLLVIALSVIIFGAYPSPMINLVEWVFSY